MNSKILQNLLILLLALAGLLAGGCATPAQSNAMVPTALGAITSHHGSITVNVTGGSATSAAGASQISNADFASALSQSIQQSKLFTTLLPAGPATDYHLEVTIVRLQQPMFGLSMTATFETNWTLSSLSDKAIVWRKAITTSHTVGAGEALAGVTRLRLATEGAARDNIQNAITQISALPLP
ncbi:MAG: hypothetical protein JWQ83_1673 [Lacunisphaera sp.]|nr:hypothetical protein [Lacunisphaera sp.]